MRFCCLCKVGNAIRLLHFLLTIFIFYVLTSSESTDLHSAWLSKNGYFFGVLSLAIISSLLYLLASFLDPGYLPKLDLTQQEVLATFKQEGKDELSSLEAGSPQLELKLPAEDGGNKAAAGVAGVAGVAAGVVEGGKYCRVCRHQRPMRAKHCYTCGHCVCKFDHHCPWLANCIGERNHRFFWMFLTVETALAAWGVAIAWSGISLTGSGWFSQSNLLLFLCLLTTFIATIVVGLLFLYHSYLMLTNQTTWEQTCRYRIHYLKDLPDLSNPFNEGCICNTFRFIFQVRPRDWETLYLTRTISTSILVQKR